MCVCVCVCVVCVCVYVCVCACVCVCVCVCVVCVYVCVCCVCVCCVCVCVRVCVCVCVVCVFVCRWVGKLCVQSIHLWSLCSYTESSHSTSSWQSSVLYQSGNRAVKMRHISTEQVDTLKEYKWVLSSWFPETLCILVYIMHMCLFNSWSAREFWEPPSYCAAECWIQGGPGEWQCGGQYIPPTTVRSSFPLGSSLQDPSF